MDLIKTTPQELAVPSHDDRVEYLPHDATQSEREKFQRATTEIVRSKAARVLAIEPPDPDDEHGGPRFGHSWGGGGAA